MDAHFTPLSKNSTVDSVINQLKDQLMVGNIKPGDKLPSELELCQSLKVSRGSLRSAMKVFEILGVVDIRAGNGTYVRSDISQNNLNPLIFSLLILRPGFDSLMQFRYKIELDILDLIIHDSKLTKDIIPKLEENLECQHQLRTQNASEEEFAENDKAFHGIIAKGCGNIIFETVYSFVFEFFWPYIYNSYKKQTFGTVAMNEHKKILDAIKSGDFTLAKTAVSESLDSWNLLVDISYEDTGEQENESAKYAPGK